MNTNTKIKYILEMEADTKNVISAVDNIKNSLKNISLPQNLNKNFLNIFSNLETEVKNFLSLNGELSTFGDFTAAEKSGKRILELYRKLGVEAENLSDIDKAKLFPPETTAIINKISKAMKSFNDTVQNNRKSILDTKKEIAKYEASLISIKDAQDKVKQKTLVDPTQFSAAQKDVATYRNEVVALQEELKKAQIASQQRMESSGRSTPDKRTKEYKNEIAIQQKLEEALKRLATAREKADSITTTKRQETELKNLIQKYNEAEINLKNLREELTKLGDGGEADAFKKMMEALKGVEGIDLSTINSYEDLEKKLGEITQEARDAVDKGLLNLNQTMQDSGRAADHFNDKLNDSGDAVKDLGRSAEDIDSLKRKLLDFFSISNAIQIFKRAVSSAFETVKELDATMTEAAVVTDFSIDDMWGKLPEYTEEASKLGAVTNDLYAATTLYYQQGLKTNAAMGIGVETMKMARIANMDATEATKAMTAALRGFNMEVNELNAQRVNDVYSELAAITAADTEQIATAMSKTASIASSANMEFENTAAFLAQIIETTQEAPETAGTALKTIIARFSEVKELRDKGLRTGEDSEGELIDVNKIDKALKSVGISMDAFFEGTEGLDQVLMRLAEKWDTLDFETQRYVATMAAGSRQQSRFIAMMSDYQRTVELANAANNSAGASQEQFNKTLDSLESKLNQLKNAWDQFVMGLANNEAIKLGVDFLTFILETVNKIINLTGPLKSFTTVLLSFLAFKGGKKVFGGLESLLKTLNPTKISSNVKDGMSSGVKGAASNIENTIRNAVAKGATDGFNQANGMQRPMPISKGKEDLTLTTSSSEKKTSKIFKNFENIQLNDSTKWLVQTKQGHQALIASFATAMAVSSKMTENFDQQLETIGERLIELSNSISNVSSKIEKTSATLNEIDDIRETYQKYQKTIKALDKNSEQYKNSVRENNKMISSILQSELGEGLVAEYKNGIYTVNENFWSEYQKKTEQQLAQLEFYKASLVSQQENLSITSKIDDVMKTSSITNEEQKNIKTAGFIGGTTAGAVGTVVGATTLGPLIQTGLTAILTSVLPGAGTFIGAIAGAAIAALIGSSGAGLFGSALAKQGTDTSKQRDMLSKLGESGIKISDEQLERIYSISIGNGEKGDKELQEFINTYETTTGESFTKLISESGLAADELNKLAIAAANAKVNFYNNQEESAYKYALSQGKSEEEAREYASKVGNLYSQESYDDLINKYSKDFDKLSNKDKANFLNAVLDEGYRLTDDNSIFFGGEVVDDEVQQMYYNRAAQLFAANKIDENKYTQYQATEDKGIYNTYGLDNKTEAERALIYSKIEEKTGFENKLINTRQMIGDTAISAFKQGKSYFTDQEFLSELTNAGKDLRAIDYNKIIETAAKLGIDNFQNYLDFIGETSESSIQEIIQAAEGKLKEKELLKEQYNFNSNEVKGFNELSLNAQSNIVAQAPSQTFQDILKVFNEIGLATEKLTTKQKEQLNNLLSSMDIKNPEDIESLKKLLKDFGVVNFEDITEGLIKFTNATEKFNLNDSILQLKNFQNSIEALEEKLKEENSVFSEEQKKVLLSAGIAEENFIKIGEDEFVYNGNIEELLSSLNTKVNLIIQKIPEELKIGVEKGQKIFNYLNDNDKLSDIEKKILNGEQLTEDSKDKALAFANTLGMNIRELSNLTSNEIALKIQDYVQTYYGNNGEIYKQNIGLQNQYQKDTTTQYLAKKDDNNRYNILEKAEVSGLQEYQKEVLNGLINSNPTILRQFEKLQKELESTGKNAKDYSLILKQLALNTINNAKKHDELKDIIKENADAFSVGEKAGLAYEEAISKITSVAKKVFGENISDDFVEKNKQQFLALVSGGEAAQQAFIDLGKKANEELLKMSGITEDNINYINSILSTIPSDIKIGGTFDATNIITSLLSIIPEADKVKQILENLGYTVDFDYEMVWMDSSGMIYGPGNQPPKGFTTQDPPRLVKVLKSVKAVATKTGFNTFDYTPSTSGGGGGGGGSEKQTKWENPYDELYNTTEELNEALRQREKLEREYDRILKNRNASLKDIRKNQLDQIASLRQEIDLQNQLLAGRRKQLQNAGQEEYADEEGNYKTFEQWGVTKYASYNENTGVITIDYDAIDLIEDTELGGAVEAYISFLEEQSEAFEEAQDAIEEAKDAIEEIKEQGKQEYLELEERVYDAIVNREQKIIDNYQTLADTISEQNSNILNSLQESIDLERQIRDNTKTEEDITEKEARLAYLQRDTSGANALEIKQLEEELADAREAYQDTLIDQEIERLNKSNEEASEQRAKQIEIMQAQLDYFNDNGKFWGEVHSIINESIGENGELISNSKLVELLKEDGNFGKLSEFGQMNWIDELVKEFITAQNGFSNWMVDKAERSGSVEFGDGVKAIWDKSNKKWVDSAGNEYKDIYYDQTTRKYGYKDVVKATTQPPAPTEPSSEKTIQIGGKINARGARIYEYAGGEGYNQYFGDDPIYTVLDVENGYLLTRHHSLSSGLTGWFKKSDVTAFKTGGIADFTGPAWLDGTKSKPEIILNAQDSKNFIVLKDILSSLMSGTKTSDSKGGDNYFDIQINVDELSSDYDVDQLADRIKNIIYEDSSYRNVNSIKFLR